MNEEGKRSKNWIGLGEENKKLSISLLIPCHNEERTIKKTIESCLDQTRPADQVIVVNDGSTDRSLEIIESFGERVISINIVKCTGNKSYAQEYGLMFVTGDVFIATDADTLMDRKFIERIEADFQDEKVSAVCGYVKSLEYNWLTACRQIDYSISQGIHKLAQGIMGFVVVIPGCAAAFRTDVFRGYVTFDHDTLTEDLDFTYKLHEQGFRVAFDNKAVVYTQDPAELKSYVNQVKRWYRGNWQNLRKHYRIFGRAIPAMELSLAFIEGLIFPASLLIMLSISVIYFLRIVEFYLVAAYVVGLYAAIVSRRWRLMLYPPFYVAMMFVNSWVFISEFIKEYTNKNRKLIWFSPARREIV